MKTKPVAVFRRLSLSSMYLGMQRGAPIDARDEFNVLNKFTRMPGGVTVNDSGLSLCPLSVERY